MRIRRPGRSVLVMAAGLLVAVPFSSKGIQASDVLVYSIGPLLLRPHLDVTERYDSNISYRPSDQVSDFITTLSPGLTLYLGKPELNFISLTYVLDSLFYADNNALNGNNHSISLQSQVQGSRISLTGRDRIQLFSNRILGAELNSLQGQRLIDYNTYSDVYKLTYAISEKTSVYLEGSYDAIDYQGEAAQSFLDYNNLVGTAGFGYLAFPKTAFFGELYYGQTATDPNSASVPKSPHSDVLGGFFGAQGLFTARLSGTIKAGYEVREFSDGTSPPGGIVVVVALDHKFTEKRTASLNYVRRSTISVQSGNTPYILGAVTAQLVQKIGTTGKWISRLGIAYTSYDYQGNVFANREDSLYTITANLDYLIRPWLTTGLNYEFGKFESNSTDVSDYDVHRVILKLAVGY
jgi:hypothetical protein